MKRRGFTLVELLVVMSIMAMLMSIMLPNLRAAKESGKRVVCRNNLRQLTMGWMMYYQNNNGELVDAKTGDPAANWVGNDLCPCKSWAEKCKAVEEGLLFRYNPDIEVYSCPSRVKDYPRTYSIVDGMNGYRNVPGTSALVVTKDTQIRRPSERGVFIDEGHPTPASWTVYYEQPLWWDFVPVRHDMGTTVSFADGHSELWFWKEAITANYTRTWCGDDYPYTILSQPLQFDNEDLERCIRMVWGSVGYTPIP